MEAKNNLQWWIENNAYIKGPPIRQPPPTPPKKTIHVDASDSGWGVTSPMLEQAGFWSPEEKELSINARKLRTIKIALQLHPERCKNSTIQRLSDTITALKYAFKQGGTALAILQHEQLKNQHILNTYQISVSHQDIAALPQAQ